ncbi:hypothetical protein LMG18101_03392 [Ralstonia flaminis]|jgi:hypothetical protein|uniref:Aspartyl/Asparaginyl beta-hydroxylase n=2 Tax=Ralstonia flaminis TaxID=3058597 RepID=A0ABN9JRU2_9RALS|nr:hypothetical protein LMG18101_03392 [Ralstonia sp. LMG 18101]
MYSPSRLYQPLAQMDDSDWQRILERHTFWQNAGVSLDEEHLDIAFHVLLEEGEIAREKSAKAQSDREFDAVAIPAAEFDDTELCRWIDAWSTMHAENYGPGITTKMGLYVIRAGGTLGFHVDGPVFLKGERADLSIPDIQRGIVELHASHRTIMPLRFNAEDSFMICDYKAPLQRGELFEFSNVLPHAYFNRGSDHAVLLVTTYLQEALLPAEFNYAQPDIQVI